MIAFSPVSSKMAEYLMSVVVLLVRKELSINVSGFFLLVR
jgi:hypothetical protein